MENVENVEKLDCECELTWLDMSINLSKSCCLRIGPRCDIPAAGVNSLSGQVCPVSMRNLAFTLFGQSL